MKDTPELISIVPIGVVQNGEDDVGRQDWSRVRSVIDLRSELAGALFGLDGFSHVIVVGWLDRVPPGLRKQQQVHPAGNERLPLLGTLALRGGARPNPLAVSVCRLLGIEGATLQVEGLDLIDGTPVLDVKPYVAAYDAISEAELPDWAQG